MLVAHELAAAIAMKNDALSRLALPQGHEFGMQRQLPFRQQFTEWREYGASTLREACMPVSNCWWSAYQR
ncbi:MAG: hypothetical protein WBN23_13715 [Woeseia sp.]